MNVCTMIQPGLLDNPLFMTSLSAGLLLLALSLKSKDAPEDTAEAVPA